MINHSILFRIQSRIVRDVSRVKERDDDLVDLSSRELQMVAIESLKRDLTGLVERLQANVVVVVEVRLVQRENVAILVNALEPGSLLRIDHGVLREHDEECAVQVAH